MCRIYRFTETYTIKVALPKCKVILFKLFLIYSNLTFIRNF